jgi:flagellar motility protein MotE (MotC chaperone)
MIKILQYWYFLVLAFFLSLAAAVGLIFMRKDAWVPVEQNEEEVIILEKGDSRSFREWRFGLNSLENIQVQMDARRAEADTRDHTLELLRAQIASERSELLAMRESLLQLRKSIEADFIMIQEQERANLQQLASIYAEVNAAAAVKVFEGLDDETVVKILSLMPAESSARVLGAMGASTDNRTLKRAAQLTSQLTKVRSR